MTKLKNSQLLSIIALHGDMAQLGMNLSAVMTLIVNRLYELLDIDGVAIEIIEDEHIAYRAGSGISEAFIGMKIPLADSLSGVCIESGQVQHCPNVRNDSRVNLAACEQVGIKAMFLIPLQYFDAPFGVVKLMSKRAKPFSIQTRAFAQLVCEQLGTVIYFCMRFGRDNLLYQATHDSMTSLSNRSVFLEELRNCINQMNETVLVFMLDMNDLKSINDEYGHRFGDAALIEISKRLKECTRPTDIVARLGGDEFAIIMKFSEHPDITSIIERMKSHINREFVFEQFHRNLSISIGHGLFPDEDMSIEPLLHRADLRMYADKQKSLSTRNRSGVHCN